MQSTSTTLLEARADFEHARKPVAARRGSGAVRFEVGLATHSLWMTARFSKTAALTFRMAHAPEGLTLVSQSSDRWTGSLELVSESARYRVRYELPRGSKRVLHYTTWITPTKPLNIPFFPRDLYVTGEGAVHTAQRGPRTGIVYGSIRDRKPVTFCYLQNLTALNDYSIATKTTPAGRVGGDWPELGYSPAPTQEHALPADREVVFSDVYLTFKENVPENEGAIAKTFLDLLAELYCEIPRPDAKYRDWVQKAEQTARDISFSPDCTYERQGKRFMMPYVGDREKPPESMVQFTVLLPLLEYEEWTGKRLTLARRLLENFPAFYNPKIGSIVRWLPGEKFGDTGEAGQKHENMDSWYLYHILFNLTRLAKLGNKRARDIFKKSLPYAIRVAKRFDYRFPIFFNTETLEIVRAESAEGAGGEHDVAGLYALVMIEAHKIFGSSQYLEEARRAADALENLGFKVGYQTNTTGFATEAMLQLYLKTGEQKYLDLMNICLANIFENMWIWECRYGHAVHYPTFFGLFPLRDAPYLAPYEELEALAKFHDLLKMGGDAIPESARLLIAEYGKYALDRVWHYFPASLPVDGLAEKSRNGHLDPGLAVPVEDLQDGWEKSGQVGQEVYGAGVALVYTTRHYKKLGNTGVLVNCDYPIVDLDVKARAISFSAAGDKRLTSAVRLIPSDPSKKLPPFVVRCGGKQVRGKLSSQGHLCFEVPGDCRVEVTW
jgi:hypothetical protein